MSGLQKLQWIICHIAQNILPLVASPNLQLHLGYQGHLDLATHPNPTLPHDKDHPFANPFLQCLLVPAESLDDL